MKRFAIAAGLLACVGCASTGPRRQHPTVRIEAGSQLGLWGVNLARDADVWRLEALARRVPAARAPLRERVVFEVVRPDGEVRCTADVAFLSQPTFSSRVSARVHATVDADLIRTGDHIRFAVVSSRSGDARSLRVPSCGKPG